MATVAVDSGDYEVGKFERTNQRFDSQERESVRTDVCFWENCEG
jgi:hypothetical protein